MIPSPLLESIKEGRCLPVIGAGFSLNADLPQGKQMPNWNKLITTLSKDLDIKSDNPLEVAEEFTKIYGRTALIETLGRELHINDVKPSQVHRHLVRLRYFDVICTTNFDNLLEDACMQEGITENPIIDKYQLALHGSSKSLKILKMHGDFSNSDLIVFTKTDYAEYNAKHDHIVKYLPSLLMTKTPLFLGYSLKDPNFIQIKDMVEKIMGKSLRKGYIVLFDANENEISEYEKMNLIALNLKTNGKSKSLALLEFIKEIGQTSDIQKPKSTLSVLANKAVLFHGQILEIRTNSNNIDGKKTSIKITDSQNAIIFQGTMENAERIGEYILSTKIRLEGSEWKEGEKYTITAENGDISVNDSFLLSEPLNLIVQTDRSVYLYKSAIIVTVIAPHAFLGSKIDFQVLNDQKTPIFEDSILVESENTGIHQKIITIQGEEWKKRGKLFEIVARYKGKTSSVTIYRSNFGATIQLDQKVYSWSDAVFITIIAPDFDLDPNIIDKIGDEPDGAVTVSTNKGKINNYKLIETGVDTGIFTGIIKLTGIPGYNVSSLINRKYPWGITRGFGPNDGLIACDNDDNIVISFKLADDQIIVASAFIKWSIGQIQWLESTYQINSVATIRVIDPDMNLNPESIDSFKVHVWSDSDPVGIDVIVYETGESTGIFEGTISFNRNESKDNQLKVKEGDSVSAKYVDTTLPPPYTSNDSLGLSSTITIEPKVMQNLLEKVSITEAKLIDDSNREIKEAKLGTEIRISAILTNTQQKDETFVCVIQIQTIQGITFFSEARPIQVGAGQSQQIETKWIPPDLGIFSVSIFVFKDLDNSVALSEPKEIKINVIPAQGNKK